ncbi:S1 family peptidase [Streptomyces sp. NPDC056405]|uniref:S1 family peptidase n=1 Tax=Streptomyces sp. NPDC056405 TaxID=3345811 RepID=UPI0035D70CAD
MGVAVITSGNSIATAVGGWRVVADTPVKGSQRAAVGATVCKSGATTKWTCGTISSYNNSVTYTDPGQPRTLVKGLAKSSVCIHKGDSGGAWITNQGQAQGLTSGSSDLDCDGSFGSADDGRQALRRARLMCEAAQAAGRPLPRRSPDGWGACGIRRGWELDWARATVAPWRQDPFPAP